MLLSIATQNIASYTFSQVLLHVKSGSLVLSRSHTPLNFVSDIEQLEPHTSGNRPLWELPSEQPLMGTQRIHSKHVFVG